MKIKGNSYKRTMSLQISHNTKASSAKIKRPYVKDVGCTPRWFFLNRPPSTSLNQPPSTLVQQQIATRLRSTTLLLKPSEKKRNGSFFVPSDPLWAVQKLKRFSESFEAQVERTKTPTLIFHPSMDTPTVLTILQPCFCITSSCCTAFLADFGKDAKSRIHGFTVWRVFFG